jgi:hypothetical protein
MAPTTQNADLLDAMAAQIEDTFGALVETYGIQIVGRMVSSPTPPCIDMYPGDLSRGTEAASFGVEGEFLFTVRARVSDNDEDGQQDLLLGFMDDVNALSVPLALLDDPTLGGLASSLDCRDPTGFVLYPFGSEQLIGFQFTCMVIRADS